MLRWLSSWGPARQHAFPLMVMHHLLGTWDRTGGAGANQASKLCQAVADLELAHSVSAFNTCYRDTGLFGVYAVAEPHKMQDLMWYTLDNLVRLCHEVSDEEVARARAQLKASLMMGLDGSSAVCEDIGRQMLTYGRRLTPAEVFLRIDSVDAAAVPAPSTPTSMIRTSSPPPSDRATRCPITTGSVAAPTGCILKRVEQCERYWHVRAINRPVQMGAGSRARSKQARGGFRVRDARTEREGSKPAKTGRGRRAEGEKRRQVEMARDVCADGGRGLSTCEHVNVSVPDVQVCDTRSSTVSYEIVRSSCTDSMHCRFVRNASVFVLRCNIVRVSYIQVPVVYTVCVRRTYVQVCTILYRHVRCTS